MKSVEDSSDACSGVGKSIGDVTKHIGGVRQYIGGVVDVSVDASVSGTVCVNLNADIDASDGVGVDGDNPRLGTNTSEVRNSLRLLGLIVLALPPLLNTPRRRYL